MDGSNVKEKIIGKASALLHWNVHSNNFDHNYLLLDFAVSIHVFYDKNKFTNFRRAIREQGLLYNTEVILIKSWGEILLPLRIGN